MVTSYCALRRKGGLACKCAGSVPVERVGQGEVGGSPQGDLHMVAAWLHGERYSYLVGGSFLARKAAWALSGCLTTDSADYCMLVNG